MAGRGKAVEAKKAIVKKIAVLRKTERVGSRIVLDRVFSVQKFLVHIMLFLGDLCKDETLFENGPHRSLSKRSDKWRVRFYGKGMAALLAFDTFAQRITKEKPTFNHPALSCRFCPVY